MLSPKAEQLINQYLNLPFPNIKNIRCPYFINKKNAKRGEIRALIGKGKPEEIIEEAKIISIKYHHNIFDHHGNCQCNQLSDKEKIDKIRNFLIDHNLGIDCSGFTAHVLREHYLEKNNIDIFKKIKFSNKKNIIRRIIEKLRPVESMSVSVLADDQNSQIIIDAKDPANITKLCPGDFMVMIDTGPNKNRNHVVLIEKIEKNIIHYVSSRAWVIEGKYDHGVARGEIEIINPERVLLDQTWEELGKINDDNETYLEARDAKIFQIRRLKI